MLGRGAPSWKHLTPRCSKLNRLFSFLLDFWASWRARLRCSQVSLEMGLTPGSPPSPSFLLNPSSPNRGLLTDPPFLPSAPDQPPSSFYMVRIISKAPCMVLRLGFLIGTPAQARHKVSGAPTHSPTHEPWSVDRLLLPSTPGASRRRSPPDQ